MRRYLPLGWLLTAVVACGTGKWDEHATTAQAFMLAALMGDSVALDSLASDDDPIWRTRRAAALVPDFVGSAAAASHVSRGWMLDSIDVVELAVPFAGSELVVQVEFARRGSALKAQDLGFPEVLEEVARSRRRRPKPAPTVDPLLPRPLSDSCVVADALVPPDSQASRRLLALTQRSGELIDSAFVLITGLEVRTVGEPETHLGALLASPHTLLTHVLRYFPGNVEGWLMLAHVRREEAFGNGEGDDIQALREAGRYAQCAAMLGTAEPTRRAADSLVRLLDADIREFGGGR